MMRVLLKCWSATGLATREDACEKKKNDLFSKVLWVTFLNVFMLKSFLWFLFTILKDDFKWESVSKKKILWKVDMCYSMIYNVKAWFDDYDFNTIKSFSNH